MNRRWQKDGVGRYPSLPSLGWFISQLPPLEPSKNAGMASASDVYAAFSALHAKSRNPFPAANTELGFYYLIADAPPSPGTEVGAVHNTGAGPCMHLLCLYVCELVGQQPMRLLGASALQQQAHLELCTAGSHHHHQLFVPVSYEPRSAGQGVAAALILPLTHCIPHATHTACCLTSTINRPASISSGLLAQQVSH